MKYVLVFFVSFQLWLTCSQEIKIEAYNDSISANHSINYVRFRFTNSTPKDLWFYVNGLTYRMYILDDLGNQINPIIKVEPEPTGLPEYILLKAMESQEMDYPFYDLSKTYKFERNRDYFLYFEYENIFKKKKTKIKTFIGKVLINPVKF